MRYIMDNENIVKMNQQMLKTMDKKVEQLYNRIKYEAKKAKAISVIIMITDEEIRETFMLRFKTYLMTQNYRLADGVSNCNYHCDNCKLDCGGWKHYAHVKHNNAVYLSTRPRTASDIKIQGVELDVSIIALDDANNLIDISTVQHK